MRVDYYSEGKHKKALSIARCGLSCCFCAKNEVCKGCAAECTDKDQCENRNCAKKKQVAHGFECEKECRKGLLSKTKNFVFTLFARRFGIGELLKCLEQNEKSGIVYHRNGITGDYDGFDNAEDLIGFIKTGKR
ncbi:MAG: DUF3795 domain-containing protein [Clostridia bacterium]|nr:DUF3795 domain-containing protein [Clostridia bacterium]